ncbi:MarR family winged helix-turn-helix transcriptional regulator [Parasphingorhabdus pacifica]
MGPNPETCGELIRPLRALLGLKQVMLQRAAAHLDPIPYAAAGLLGELVQCGESRASDLAQHRIVDASVVSRQVAQLEHAGFITRRQDPADRRVALLKATEEGEQVMEGIEKDRAGWLMRALRDWDDESVRNLSELLTAATEDLRREACELAPGGGETKGSR